MRTILKNKGVIFPVLNKSLVSFTCAYFPLIHPCTQQASNTVVCSLRVQVSLWLVSSNFHCMQKLGLKEGQNLTLLHILLACICLLCFLNLTTTSCFQHKLSCFIVLKSLGYQYLCSPTMLTIFTCLMLLITVGG